MMRGIWKNVDFRPISQLFKSIVFVNYCLPYMYTDHNSYEMNLIKLKIDLGQ